MRSRRSSLRPWGLSAWMLASLLGFLPVLAATTSALPPPRYPFRSFGDGQGLHNLNILSVHQGADGFLWAGTQNGLYRYDGQRFHRFGQEEGLPGLFIHALASGPDGTLWVGTDQGLAFAEGGRFREAAGETGRIAVNALLVEHPDRVWVGTNQGLFLGNRRDGFRAAAGWRFGSVHALLVKRGTLWVGSERGVVKAEGEGRWRSCGPGREPVFALAVDGRDRLWARGPDHLWVRSMAGGDFQSPPAFPRASTPSQGISLFVDRRGRLWVPGKDQVSVLDGDKWRVLKAENGLPTPWVRQVFQDGEGSLWFAGVGLHQLLGNEAWTYFTDRNGLPSNTVWAVHRDRRGTLWVGTNLGVARCTPAGWQVLPGTQGDQVVCMAELMDGRLVGSGSPTTLLEWNPASSALKRHALPLPKGDMCLAMAVDRKGDLWICTRDSGLLVGSAHGPAWSFRRASTPESHFREEFTDLEADTSGSIWVITQSALYHFQEAGCWRFTPREGIPDNPFTLGRLRNGEMVLGSRTSLDWIRFRQGEEGLEILERHPGRERIRQDPVYAAGQDAAGRIWLGGGQGLEIQGQGRSRFLGPGDGPAWCDVNHRALLAEPDGDVWIGTRSGGLAHYHPVASEEGPPPPPSRLWRVSLGDQVLDPAALEERTVPWHAKVLVAQFAGLGFRNPERLQVQTRLLGLDATWRAADGRSLTIPGLPPGHYRLEVRSRYDDGSWGPITGLAFHIGLPWWRTWPCLVLEGLAVVAGIWSLVRLRTVRLAVRNRRLQARVEEATREILQHEEDLERMNADLRTLDEQKNRFLAIAAHDLRTPLGSIAVAAELLQGAPDPLEVAETARMIQRESLGMRDLVGRFLDAAALEAGTLCAEPQVISLLQVVADILSRHGERAEAKAQCLEADFPPECDAVKGDPRFVDQILDNLVSNALKFTPPHRKVSLSAQLQAGEVVVTVADQGPGLTTEDRDRVFRPFTRLSAKATGGERSTGLGLSIARSLVQLQGGRIWVESEPGLGAAFSFTLPRA